MTRVLLLTRVMWAIIILLVTVFHGTLIVFVAEVTVRVRVIGSSVSAPEFSQSYYSVTIPESTPRLTNFLNITAKTDPTGNGLHLRDELGFAFI